MNSGNNYFPKLQLVKTSGRLIYKWLVEVMVIPGMKRIISQILETCPICTMKNPNTRPFRGPQIEPIQTRRTYVGEDWQIDFTVMTRYEAISGIF